MTLGTVPSLLLSCLNERHSGLSQRGVFRQQNQKMPLDTGSGGANKMGMRTTIPDPPGMVARQVNF